MKVRRRAGGDGRGRQYCRPRPGRLHCATRAQSLGSGREVSGCGDGSVGALGRPSPGPRARLPGLRDWERATRAPLRGIPPTPDPGLTLHCQQDAPEQHGRGGRLDRGASREPAGTGCSGWKERGKRGRLESGEGEVRGKGCAWSCPTLQSGPGSRAESRRCLNCERRAVRSRPK